MTMTTLTGRNARTLSGYVESLLDYPRWIIERLLSVMSISAIAITRGPTRNLLSAAQAASLE